MTNVKNFVLGSAKAIVPLAVMGILALLGTAGVTRQMTVEEVATLVVTSVLVWLTRNKQ